MKGKTTIKIQEEIPDTHYFVYKDQKYPINFNLFIYSSKYFLKNQNSLKQNKYINLVDKESEDKLDLPVKTIQDFINYVHREPIDIDDQNVSILNYLATRYEINSLISFTQDYINQNQKDVIIEILIINQNDPTINTTSYEDFISKDLLYFIQDDRLLSINFPILYRILNRYEKVPTEELIEFYFKCLDRYGRVASILFTKVDFSNSKSEFYNRIMTKYSNVFDFHFIDASFLAKTNEIESQLLRQSKETEDELEAQKETNKKLNDEITALKSSLNDHKIKIDELNEVVQSLVSEQSKQKREMDEKVDALKRKFEDEIAHLTGQIGGLKEIEKQLAQNAEDNKNVIELQHQSGREFQGIFKYLTDHTGGNIHVNGTLVASSNSIYNSSHHPKNLLDFNESNLYQSINANDNAYIRFDFKEKSIQLSGYSIKSYNRSDGGGALRSWVIEVSNDESSWQPIDRHTDDPTFKGKAKFVATFNIQNQTNNFYRYIQLRRTGPNWLESENYYIYFYYMELYGKLKTQNK